MPILVNEETLIDENVFKFEEKIKSPSSRFIDTNPTFVTYFHVNADETTADEGFQDIASIIGSRSPIRFKKIDKFPLYGIEQMVLQLQEEDQGLDSSFESEAIILPNTIKPLYNDFFIISYLHEPYMFRVIDISYDSIMPDNFYKISFKLDHIDEEKITQIEKQVHEEFTCVLDNIGTENHCFIENSEYHKINDIENMYNDMVNTYLTLFYNETHNCLLGEYHSGLRFIYDPYQTWFINKHKLFQKKKDYVTISLSDQFTDNKRKIKYEKSIYRFIERKDLSFLSNFNYVTIVGRSFVESSFYRWMDESIDVLEIPDRPVSDSHCIFSDEYVMSIRTNGFTDSCYADMIQRFVRNEDITLSDIKSDLSDELIHLNNSLEIFFLTPIILYIIKDTVNKNIIKK